VLCHRCGNILSDSNELFCLQCGWRTDTNIPQRIERKLKSVRVAPVVPFKGLVEEYLDDTNDATQKAKRLLSENKELVRFFEYYWFQQNLAQRFTLYDLFLLECYAAYDEEIENRFPDFESIIFLRRFRLDNTLGTSHKPIGGRPISAKVFDLALKLVLCASYQWLRTLEVEREIAKSMYADRKKVRAAAYMSVKNAHQLARRILFRLGPDIDLVHAILTRAIWEDKYQPVVITVNGYVSDVTY
jgi:predicted  nucleic acid-binding Zn-ribbon protein